MNIKGWISDKDGNHYEISDQIPEDSERGVLQIGDAKHQVAKIKIDKFNRFLRLIAVASAKIFSTIIFSIKNNQTLKNWEQEGRRGYKIVIIKTESNSRTASNNETKIPSVQVTTPKVGNIQGAVFGLPSKTSTAPEAITILSNDQFASEDQIKLKIEEYILNEGFSEIQKKIVEAGICDQKTFEKVWDDNQFHKKVRDINHSIPKKDVIKVQSDKSAEEFSHATGLKGFKEVYVAPKGLSQFKLEKGESACSALACRFLATNLVLNSENIKKVIEGLEEKFKISESLSTEKCINDMELKMINNNPGKVIEDNIIQSFSDDGEQNNFMEGVTSLQFNLNPKTWDSCFNYLQNEHIHQGIMTGIGFTIAFRKNDKDPKIIECFDSHGFDRFSSAYIITFDTKTLEGKEALKNYIIKRFVLIEGDDTPIPVEIYPLAKN